MVEAIKKKIKVQSLYTNYDKKFPVNERGLVARAGIK